MVSPQENAITIKAILQKISYWEGKIVQERKLIEDARTAMKEEKSMIKKQQAKLADRRSQWKSHARNVKPNDEKAKKTLKVFQDVSSKTRFFFSNYF